MIRREVWVWIQVRKAVARRTLTHFIDKVIPDSQVLNECDTAGCATVTVLYYGQGQYWRSAAASDNCRRTERCSGVGERVWCRNRQEVPVVEQGHARQDRKVLFQSRHSTQYYFFVAAGVRRTSCLFWHHTQTTAVISTGRFRRQREW